MNTFILKWNPAISSYDMDRFEEDFGFLEDEVLEDESPWDFNWSVWEHDKAHSGDRFFMLRVGEGGNNGILMSGTFISEPYEGEDWSGKGRRTYYMDMEFDAVVNVTSSKVLPTALLAEQLPAIEWTKGHSGVMLRPDDALKLEKLWYNRLKASLSPRARALQIARIAHFGQRDKAGADYLTHPVRVAECLVDEEEIVALLHDVVEDTAYTVADLAREGFSDAVIEAIRAITRGEGEPYEAYIRRLGQNPIARAVKLADLRDNLDLLRLPELTDTDLEHALRYHRAYRYLSSL